MADPIQLAAAQACNSAVENGKAGAMQDCSDVINISLFFDGTSHNKTACQNGKADAVSPNTKGASNVVCRSYR